MSQKKFIVWSDQPLFDLELIKKHVKEIIKQVTDVDMRIKGFIVKASEFQVELLKQLGFKIDIYK